MSRVHVSVCNRSVKTATCTFKVITAKRFLLLFNSEFTGLFKVMFLLVLLFQKMFSDLDKNNDRLVSLDEYLEEMSKPRPKPKR